MMKKCSLTVILFLSVLGLFAQQYTTVSEMKMENQLAERIEKLLFPIIGHNVAVVDVTLKYPSEGLIPFGTSYNKKESLPGLPVAKSEGVMGKEIDDEPTLPTLILNKKISIYVDEMTDRALMDKVRNQLNIWLNINIENGDLLEILPKLEIPVVENDQNKSFKMFYYILIVFLAIQLIMLFIFIKKADISTHLITE